MPRRYSSPSPWDDDPLGTLLETEAALARAEAGLGRIPQAAADAIVHATQLPYDYNEVRDFGEEHATIVVPLLERLRWQLAEEYHQYLHKPATSQDIMDTALMLQASRNIALTIPLLDRGIAAVSAHAAQFGETPQRGRTLLQPALPTTFGNLLISWRSAIEDARDRLLSIRGHSLAAQLGGPVGDLDDPELVAAFAAELGLAAPDRPWHTVRTRVVDLACALGLTVGALGKIGTDVIVLSQPEIGELEEGVTGWSSSMPGKRNAARSVQLVALAQRAPGLVATVFSALPQELHRAAGRWQAEDAVIRELLVIAGKAAHHAVTVLEGLRVFPDRMKANLDG